MVRRRDAVRLHAVADLKDVLENTNTKNLRYELKLIKRNDITIRNDNSHVSKSLSWSFQTSNLKKT